MTIGKDKKMKGQKAKTRFGHLSEDSSSIQEVKQVRFLFQQKQ